MVEVPAAKVSVVLAAIAVVVGRLNVKEVPFTTDATIAPVGTLVPVTN